jgi:hypothetical protein
LPIKTGSKLNLRLTLGIGCLIDPILAHRKKDEVYQVGAPLAVGAKYVLTIKYDKAANTYEHAQGAGAAYRVKEFTGEDKAVLAKLRAFAALPLKARLERTRKILAEAKPNLPLHNPILGWVHWRKSEGSNVRELGLAEISEDEFNEIEKTLLVVWHRPIDTHTLDDLWKPGRLRRAVLLTAPVPQTTSRVRRGRAV